MDILWNRLDAAAWDAVLPDTATGMQHSWRYGAAVAALGRRVHRAEIWSAGRFLGLAQVLTRRAGPLTLALAPRGPAWTAPETAPVTPALRALRASLPGGGVRALCAAAPGARSLPLISPVFLAELPLSADPDRMRARLRGKWRNRLARAEQAGMKIAATIPSPGDLERLVVADRAQAARVGYRGLSPAFLAAWAAQPGAPLRLYQARAGGDVIASMLFLDHAPGVTYHIGTTTDEGRHLGAHHRLLWAAMCDFGGRGRRALDLGPLDTTGNPGLARFKLGTGATALDLGATGLILPAPWHRRRRPHDPGRLAVAADPD